MAASFHWPSFAAGLLTALALLAFSFAPSELAWQTTRGTLQEEQRIFSLFSGSIERARQDWTRFALGILKALSATRFGWMIRTLLCTCCFSRHRRAGPDAWKCHPAIV